MSRQFAAIVVSLLLFTLASAADPRPPTQPSTFDFIKIETLLESAPSPDTGKSRYHVRIQYLFPGHEGEYIEEWTDGSEFPRSFLSRATIGASYKLHDQYTKDSTGNWSFRPLPVERVTPPKPTTRLSPSRPSSGSTGLHDDFPITAPPTRPVTLPPLITDHDLHGDIPWIFK